MFSLSSGRHQSQISVSPYFTWLGHKLSVSSQHTRVFHSDLSATTFNALDIKQSLFLRFWTKEYSRSVASNRVLDTHTGNLSTHLTASRHRFLHNTMYTTSIFIHFFTHPSIIFAKNQWFWNFIFNLKDFNEKKSFGFRKIQVGAHYQVKMFNNQ